MIKKQQSMKHKPVEKCCTKTLFLLCKHKQLWCWGRETYIANAVCLCVADEVPGSAVLVFDIELIDMEEGLPEGYMFIWNDDVSPDLFAEMDKDENKQVEPSEVRDNLLMT